MGEPARAWGLRLWGPFRGRGWPLPGPGETWHHWCGEGWLCCGKELVRGLRGGWTVRTAGPGSPPPTHRLEGKILPSLAPPACWRCAHPASPAPAGLPNCFPLSERAGCERLIRRDKRPIGKQALPLPGHRSPRLFWVLCPWPCLSLKRQWAACGRSWEHVGVLLRRGGQHPAGKDQEPSLTSELLGSYYVLDLASCFWTLAP